MVSPFSVQLSPHHATSPVLIAEQTLGRTTRHESTEPNEHTVAPKSKDKSARWRIHGGLQTRRPQVSVPAPHLCIARDDQGRGRSLLWWLVRPIRETMTLQITALPSALCWPTLQVLAPAARSQCYMVHTTHTTHTHTNAPTRPIDWADPRSCKHLLGAARFWPIL